MKAAQLYGINDIRVEDVSMPQTLDGNEVRLMVDAVGICGSDLHNFQTGQWMDQLPMVPGHEMTGTVIELGQNVQTLSLGDKVVADSRVWCGQCSACQAQRYNHCPSLAFVGESMAGGMSEQVVLKEQQLLKVANNLAADIRVLSEPLGVSLRVVKQLAATPGALVHVAGGGAIGGFAALLLQDIFAHPVQLSEPNQTRFAKLSALMQLSPKPRPFHFAIDATGIPMVINQLIEQIEPGGRIALVGLPQHNDSIDILRVVEKEITLVGCSVFDTEQREAIAYLAALQDKLKSLISPPLQLKDVPDTYDKLCRSHVDYLKAVIYPNRH
ncbi:zinc-dependent alcohol dehydrogenase [Celerinatantimonas diazotrophica]|uniref:(R,R)-butanediol dehydrogenase/meso-butanediol dehydrogenase/diacetyl reductase n=1 Tax=Celerinatantimonas diazotrophica TaxID=412034 RepID=A0A4R1K1M4_9GAMM|nr:alcohol dehydrogenase catalytic domain-containing protein [Celerinatantimonas diazotrophica]TCK57800.1 (R,R)-butanediol dehydrogenase/meso-butanediol dehydrogenase/diacetyl reductase [Celerinatantimonas diazotrophica]CAG9298136.1 Sorbitol dehydrogenase [Celerinatantimonas diazotrophica]